MSTYVLDIPDVPPSINQFGFGGRGVHMKMHRLKKSWEYLIWVTLLETGVPKRLKKVTAKACLRFKTKRRRDEGNFRWILEKALGDVLQENGHLPDDTPDQYRFTELTFEEETGHPRTLLTLETVQ